MSRDPDEILTLAEIAAALKLDPRTVKRAAYRLGGECIGNRWRFRWGTVMESFGNANSAERQRKLLDGACNYQRKDCGNAVVSGRAQTRPGVDGMQKMGVGKEKRTAQGARRPADPYGLRAACGLG